MHADEANQGVKAGELLEFGRYAFDPGDHHGPTLYFLTLPVAWARGEDTLASLSEISLRLVPALAGTAAVLFLGLLAMPTGHWPAIAAAAFLAVSPPAVYYSRYFIQETLLVAFTLGTFLCVTRWWKGGRPGWAVAAGIGLGLMQATKGSAGLFIVAGLIGLMAIRPRPPLSFPWRRDAFLALAAALLVMGLFHSSFGTHPAGLRDMFAVAGHAATRLGGDSGHEKPWWYYLSLFGWQRNGGLVWEQVLFSGLSVAGLAVAAMTRKRLLRWAAIYTLIIATVLSLTPYKTPWHSVHFVPGLAVLAAGTLAAIGRLRGGRFVAAAATFLCLGSLGQQAWRAALLRPADARNPYAYVHSSPDVRKYRPLVEAALAGHPDQPIHVISEEYWPLPWYLRGLSRVGYWPAVPDDCDGALVIVSTTLVEVVKPRLRGAYRESILGLRPGFILVILSREPAHP
jgi:uncharacterized protein (TIGR03663 family)